MNKILVTGSEGILGRALLYILATRHFEVAGTDIRSKNNTADIANYGDIQKLINYIKPDIVIHAAAYTDVDECEHNTERAYRVNGEGAKNVAEACRMLGAFLIYISTDYVFDGENPAPYCETDRPNPINIYGMSKLRGEEHIKNLTANYLIIRTSWLFGRGGRNFVDTIIKKAGTEKRIKVVNDQRGTPTYAADLAEAIFGLLPMVGRIDRTILNVTNSGSCTWYEFAKEIIRINGMSDVSIEPASSALIGRPARRPAMSVLDNSKFEILYGKKLPSWQDALNRYMR